MKHQRSVELITRFISNNTLSVAGAPVVSEREGIIASVCQ